MECKVIEFPNQNGAADNMIEQLSAKLKEEHVGLSSNYASRVIKTYWSLTSIDQMPSAMKYEALCRKARSRCEDNVYARKMWDLVTGSFFLTLDRL